MAARTARGRQEKTEVPSSRKVPTEHGRELFALALLGAAAFVLFALLAPERAGFLGRGVSGLLSWGFGRMSVLVPLALLALAGAIAFGRRPDPRSPYLLGGFVLVVSLFALGAGGIPPFGEPGAAGEGWAPIYESRTGVLGDALWGWGSPLLGQFGLAVAAWLGLIAGTSLVTGVTIRRAFAGTRRVARTARVRAEQTFRQEGGKRWDGEGPLDDPYLRGFGGKAEGDGFEEETVRMSRAAAPEDALPEDYDGRPRAVGPALLNGAEVFPDLFSAGEIMGGAEAGADPGVAGAGDEIDAPSGNGEGRRSAAGGTDVPPAADAPSAGIAGRDGVVSASGDDAAPVYRPPGADLLRKSGRAAPDPAGSDERIGRILTETLAQFGVQAELAHRVVGPRVTRYELQLAPGTKVSKVTNLRDDLAYALASTEIRILAPIPGKSAVGVEVPNQSPDFVTLGDIYRDFPSNAGPLMVWLGKDISGNPVYTDLAQLPHLLIAGTTGSGKSGSINSILASVLLRASPEQVRMIMIDPKKVELSHFDRIPHLLVPVVTNMKNAAGVLHNIIAEMENRYELMELDKARHLEEMNKARARRGESPLPYLLVVIDELADLMMFSPTEVEEHVIRLAQKARAVGIHLVVATQRPSADVITGMIKANIPSRIAFAVSSQTDSRVILDVNGAETLLGQGDMLFKPLGQSRLKRVQGAYISEEEIALLVQRCRAQAEPEFRDELLELREEARPDEDHELSADKDELLADAAELVLDTGSASVSMLQRRLRVGYTRAGRIIDMLERRGIVGPYEGSRPRTILVSPEDRTRVLEGLGLRFPGAGDESEPEAAGDAGGEGSAGGPDEEVTGRD